MSKSESICSQSSAKPGHNKRKKAYYFNGTKKRKHNQLEPGFKGFMIAHNNNEKCCISEAYRLLNEYADKLFSDEQSYGQSDVRQDSDQELDQALAKEIDQLKAKRSRFQNVSTNCKNILFIKVSESIDPFQLTQAIFEEIKETKKFLTKRVLRLIPVAVTCKYKLDAILKAFEQVIEAEIAQECTFKIEAKIRNNNDITKTQIIQSVFEIVKQKRENWKVNFVAPELIINVDVLNKIGCISILKNYYHFKRYNPNEFSYFVNKGSDCGLINEDTKESEREPELEL